MFVNLIGDPSYSKDAISAAIDKYVYVVINSTPLVNHVSARYSITESVHNVRELKNERIREALLKFGINNNIEIGSFASFPMEIGFKSYLSFTSALACGLHSSVGVIVDGVHLAKEVFEIEKLAKGKGLTIQGAHSASSGGINVYTFGPKGTLFQAKPLFLDFHERLKFENLLSVYYVKQVLINKREKRLKRRNKYVSDSIKTMVAEFKRALVNGDTEECAFILHKSWMLEKTIGINVPPDIVEEIYGEAIASGVLGGKYIGDTTGGCLLLLGKKGVLGNVDKMFGMQKNLTFTKFKIGFVQSGARTIFKLNA